MGSIVRQVMKERIIIRLFIYKPNGIISKSIRCIIGGLRSRQIRIIQSQAPSALRFQIAGSTGQYSIKMLKSPLQRPLFLAMHPNMPFACHVCMIASLFQHLSNCHTITVEKTHITMDSSIFRMFFSFLDAGIFRHSSDAGLLRIKSGQQAGTGRTRTSRIIKLRISYSLLCQPVNIGSRNLTAITPNIRISHVICHNKYNIRSFISFFAGSYCFVCHTRHSRQHRQGGCSAQEITLSHFLYFN